MKKGERCPHGILYPHECTPCADFHWANRQRCDHDWIRVENGPVFCRNCHASQSDAATEQK